MLARLADMGRHGQQGPAKRVNPHDGWHVIHQERRFQEWMRMASGTRDKVSKTSESRGAAKSMPRASRATASGEASALRSRAHAKSMNLGPTKRATSAIRLASSSPRNACPERLSMAERTGPSSSRGCTNSIATHMGRPSAQPGRCYEIWCDSPP